MSLVILNGGATASVLQNTDLSLTELNDVTLTSVASGDILKYNGTQFVNVDVDTLLTSELTEIDGGTY